MYRNDHDEEILHFLRRSRLPLGHEGAIAIELQKRQTMPRFPVQ